MSEFKNETHEEIYNSAWGKRIRAEHEEREATRYTGPCPGCGEQRTDLFLIDNPVLCGDCGLEQMVKDLGGFRIK